MKTLLLALCSASLLLPAQAHTIKHYATLNGANEAPANTSPGTGVVFFNYDHDNHRLQMLASFSGLEGLTTAAHIHAPTVTALTGTAGVATTTPTFAGFPNGVTSGTYSNTLDLTLASSYNAAYLTANGGTPATAEAALVAAIAAGKAYFNLHTSVYGGGEIRGFLVPIPVTAPQIEEIALFPGNQVVLHFDTEANRAYTLEYTDSLPGTGPWQPLYQVPSQPFMSHYVVPDSRTNAQRFYRLLAVP